MHAGTAFDAGAMSSYPVRQGFAVAATSVAALVLLATSAPAFAGMLVGALQLPEDAEEEPPPPPVRHPPPPLVPDEARPASADVGLRPIFGIGLHMGWAQGRFSTLSTAPLSTPSLTTTSDGGVGLYARVGLQVDDRFGVEAELSGETVFVAGDGAVALLSDYSPSDRFTFALGPSVRLDSEGNSCGCADSPISVTSAGGTARLDIHLAVLHSSGGRSAATLGIALNVGAVTGASGFCAASYWATGPVYGVALTFGYSRY